MGDSIWKKEISFGKKSKEPAEPKPESTSFLKKEISFSRKPKEPKAPKATGESTSFLKKEISFSRKPKEPKAPKGESTSIWKKDISLGKGKAKQDELARLMESAAQAVDPSYDAAPVPVVPPTALAEAVVASMPPAEPVLPEPPAVAYEPQPQPAFEPHPAAYTPPAPAQPVEPEPFALAPVPEPAPAPVDPEPVVLEPAPEPAFEPLPAAFMPSTPVLPVEPLPVQPEPVAYLPQPIEPVPVQPEPVAYVPQPVEPADVQPEPVASVPQPIEPVPVQPEPVASVPQPIEPVPVQPEPVAYAPQPVEPTPIQPEPVAYEPVAAEPWLAGPELPPEPTSVTPPVVVHPPVPAAELPPLPDKVPFWKKEIGGKKKGAPAATGEPSVPFWKKEIGGKKKSAPAATGEPSVPFWKKEIGGKKKVAADAPTAVIPVAKSPSAPFWKQLSFSLPSLSRGGGKHTAKKLVGLKVGASQIAAACVSNNGSVQLERVAREPLLPGVVVGGELRDPDALGDALKAFFERNKLPKKGVRLGLASNRIGVRIVDIVGVAEEKQLANAVQFRAQEALPIPLDEAVLDYRVLGESADGEGQPVKRVLLVVAHKELVERYVEACKRAGIQLMGIDLEAFALLRALSAPVDRGASAVVAVSVGHDRSTFAVSDGRTCEFTRVLEWGGWMLNVALARVFESTPSEVEALKRGLSLDGSVQPETLTPEQLAVALDALRKQVQVFARELVSSLQFYQGQPGSLGIGEIVLTGGTAHLPGLAEELQRLIGVPVRVGDPLARLVVTKKVGTPEQVGSLAVAIGLGIED